jgi:hypothetical protein
MSTDLVVVIPSRGRPETVERTMVAFAETGADEVPVVWAVEADDPTLDEYRAAVERWAAYGSVEVGTWGAMTPAINAVSVSVLADLDPFAIAVLNDDHVPRTPGWAGQLVDALRTFHPGAGMVYPDDGYQGKKLSTVWAVTGSWVRALGRMVPARVGHLYTDNAVLELATAVGCVTYLPGIEITHEHPAAGYGEWTEGHKRVNSREQYAADRNVFRHWQRSNKRRQQIETLRAVIRGA